MFYTFIQNNSGGWFDKGIGHYVIVEGDTVAQIVERAKDEGLYFDGEGGLSMLRIQVA